VGRLVFSSKG